MPLAQNESQKYQSWSQRFTQVKSGRTLEYPDKPDSRIIHPADFLSRIAWGAEETKFQTVWQMFAYLRRNVSKLRRESDLACARLAILKWKLIPADKSDQSQAVTEIFQEFLESLNIAKLVESQWDAIDWGFWVAGFQWAYRNVIGKNLWLPKVAPLPQWGFDYVLNSDTKLELRLRDDGAWDEERIKAIKDAGGTPAFKNDSLGSHLPDRAVLPIGYKATPTTPWGEGLIQAVYRDLYYHDILEYRQKWYSESYDMPYLLVRIPRGDTKAQLEADTMLADLGGYYRGIAYTNYDAEGNLMSEGMSVEFIQPQRSSGEIFNPTILRVEDKIHSLYSGGQLDSDKPAAGEGSLALARTHADTTDKVTAAQARAIQEWYNTLIDWCWDANPDLQVALPPRFEFITEEEVKGSYEKAQTQKIIADTFGVFPPDSQLREDYDYEEVTAENPSSYVKPAAQPANPFGQPGFGLERKAGVKLENIPEVTANDNRITAADSYAGRVGARAVAPIIGAIKTITDRYRDPKAPLDPRNTKEVLDRIKALGAAIPTIGKEIPLGIAAKGIDLDGLRVPLDLLPLIDSLYDAQVSGFLGGYAHGADQVHNALDKVMARGLEHRAEQIYSRGLMLEGTSVYPDGIYPATDAWKLFVERSRQPMSSEAWALAEAALKQRSIGYAYVADQVAVAKLTKKIEDAIAMGYSQDQFIAMVNNELAATGLTSIQPYYLETVFRTVVQQEYGKGQSELVNQIDGGIGEGMTPIIWGYWWSTNLGKEPHHPGHLEMNLFAAPVGHHAWTQDGWNQGCDYRCACARIMVLWIVAQDRDWLGKEEPVKPYPGIVPRFQLVS